VRQRLTLCAVKSEATPPSAERLEEQARRLLEEARLRSGTSVEKMVKVLGRFQPRGAETRRSWYDWQERPETVSLLTGLAAIHLLGPEAAVELLFGHAATSQESDAEGVSTNLHELRHSLADVIVQMTEMRERVDGLIVPELEKQGELMAKMLSDMRQAGILSGAGTEEVEAQRGRTADGR
jgi:hypothetical protein